MRPTAVPACDGTPLEKASAVAMAMRCSSGGGAVDEAGGDDDDDTDDAAEGPREAVSVAAAPLETAALFWSESSEVAAAATSGKRARIADSMATALRHRSTRGTRAYSPPSCALVHPPLLRKHSSARRLVVSHSYPAREPLGEDEDAEADDDDVDVDDDDDDEAASALGAPPRKASSSRRMHAMCTDSDSKSALTCKMSPAEHAPTIAGGSEQSERASGCAAATD